MYAYAVEKLHVVIGVSEIEVPSISRIAMLNIINAKVSVCK